MGMWSTNRNHCRSGPVWYV